ncbi:SRPBCC family protein [Enterococcus sp. LJL128]|uniref:SRPBCC family protein n=1 Tax=Enterococcus sp. LJL51 TaxID=3416656 RepID=UPI003CFB0C5A
MTIATIKAVFDQELPLVWQIVTSLEEYSWRSDLSRIEILEPGKTFVEYTKDNYGTTFTITALEQYSCYAFDMDNDKMRGHWIGRFEEQGGKTAVEFTEDIQAKKFFLKPFVSTYLKKQQKTYIQDLKKYLEKVK